ncbi:MAG: TonB-dependent receptor, partial [Bdellovibrionales bacterium]|nr:TonB-dependent receptor [Bdellovibrionales bacterium]
INIDSLKPKKEKKNLQGVEKIEVTGSHIKRIDIEGPSPVTVIDREDIDKTAYNSVADVLRDSTASSFGAAKEQSGSTAAGVAAVSLRGLGSNRTLVLLNGKRLPVDAAGGVPDLNLIPIAAVERVEILKDGASAIYGSDALGGVVNIITRKDFSGTEVSMQQSTTELGGGDKFDISIVNGFTKGRLNLVTVAQHRNNSEIDSSQRFWNSEGTSTTGSPGSVRQSAPEGSPPGPWQTDNYCPEGQTDVSPYAPNENTPNLRCTYRYGVLATQLPSIQQTSLLSEANVDLKGNTQLKLRVSGTQKSTKWHYAPAPDRIDGIPGNTFQSVSELPGTIDATQPVDLLYRTVELGNRETEITTNAYNILTGLKGEMSETWEWEASANINRVFRNDIGVSGYALYDQIENKVRNKEFNPLASPGARGSLEDTRYQPYQNSMSELAAADFVASGEIGEFLGQPLSLALGAQATSQEYEETVDFQTAAGNVWGNVGSEGGGRRDTQSAFSELSIPVGEKLEMQVAGRFDHYSDFGDTFNPKLGMRYMISPKILLRASAGTGFKAPDMVDLYAGDSNGFPTFIDHTLCAQQKAAGGATPACLPDQHPVQSSGNKGLKEEKSESY